MIISLSGTIGSGKNTVASYLIEKHNFLEESFAKPLKDSLCSIFLWDRDMLEGKNQKLRNLREETDEWWEEKLSIKNFSPRRAMTLIGTDIFRKFLNEDIWIFSLEKRLEKIKDKNIVITDCRFTNEANFLKSINAKLILIEKNDSRKKLKEIVKEAKKGNIKAVKILESKNIHISEWDLIDYDFDYVLENNGTIEDLFKKIDFLIEELKNKNVIQKPLQNN